MSAIRHLAPSHVEEVAELEAFVEARIATGSVELAVFPASAKEVLDLCESGDVDYKKLAAAIRRDAIMTGHFMALANSAAFGGGRAPLVSLPQALARLGTVQTKQVALVIACRSRAFVVPGRPKRGAELLTHALHTALLAQEIARTRRLNVEEAFLCGLLHDIGRPAVLQLCHDLAGSRSREAVTPEAAEAVADALHARVGALVAKQWSFPDAIADVTARHHADLVDQAGSQPCERGVAIVQLADLVTRKPTADALADHPAVDLLNLYPDDLDALIARRDELGELA